MRVTVLGTAQDGGVPHLGCRCRRCERARRDPAAVRYPASILVEGDPGSADETGEEHSRVLVDATPDVRHQVADVDAVVLTHAHAGHLPGLLQFGREAADADSLPVYCTADLARVVRENAPFSLLCDRGNVDLRTVDDGDAVPLAGDGELGVRRVPHRDELGTGTLAVSAAGAHRTLRYIPDLDGWTDELVDRVDAADVALVDGTFWSDAELDRRAEVPHPRIEESIRRLASDGSVRFVHLNHTNPVLDPESDERRAVENAGFGVAERGDAFDC